MIPALLAAAAAAVEATAPVEPAAPAVEAEAALGMGLTSNLQRARRGGEADGLLDLEGVLEADALDGRLAGGLDLAFRQPLGLPELRHYAVLADATVDWPVGPVSLGAALAAEAERELTVFTETGTLGAASARRVEGGRVGPFVSWAPEPWRLELGPVAGVRQVSGAERYDLGELGVRLRARWFDLDWLHAGASVGWAARHFDGLHARTRDGRLPAVAPAVSLQVLDADLHVAAHPREDLDLVLRLGLSRLYDDFDGYHGHLRTDASAEARYAPERGPGGELSGAVSRRTYAVRLATPVQSGDESEVELRAGAWYTVRPWLVPSLRYEMRFAEAGSRGTLFTEHVGLVAWRGRY